MASQTSTLSLLFLLLLVSSSFLACESRRQPVFGRPKPPFCFYDAIYQFGDSISDTGNLISESPSSPSAALFTHLPYGETHFHKATGRCSDGLLMIDYIAQSLNLPLLEPYLKGKDRYPNGVNFAVAGSTALPTRVLLQLGVLAPVTNSSLDVQLGWFLDHVQDVVNSPEGPSEQVLLHTPLFMVGETGGNDYNYAFLQGKPMSEVRDLVPLVVDSIINIVEALVARGARRLVVPGNFPIGCAPSYLTRFMTDDPNAYDDRFCLTDLNDFAKYHNDMLKTALEDVRRKHPEVKIMYADYYGASESLMNRVTEQGYGNNMLQACCGAGEKYNFNMTSLCGTPASSTCEHPEQYISWDGIHGTQMAYQYMADWLLRDMKLTKQCA